MGPFISVTNSRPAPPGSSRIEFTRASIPSTWPVPSSLPVIGRVAKSLSSRVNGVDASGGAASAAHVAAATRAEVMSLIRYLNVAATTWRIIPSLLL